MSKIKKMFTKNVQHLREKIGLSLIDMQWITGSMIRKWKVDEDAEISDPSFAILIRYLTKYPEENPLPKTPKFHEIEEMISMYWDRNEERKLNAKRMGPLFGCSPLAGYKWQTDSQPSQTIRHIMLILSNAIKKDGKAGLARYLEVVKEEARARSITEDDLWLKGWMTYSRRDKAKKAKEKEAEDALSDASED